MSAAGKVIVLLSVLFLSNGCRKDCCDYRESWTGNYAGDYHVQTQHFFPPWSEDTTYVDVVMTVSLVDGSDTRMNMHVEGGSSEQFDVDEDGTLHHSGLTHGAFTVEAGQRKLDFEFHPPMGGNQTMLLGFTGYAEIDSL